MPSSSIAQNLNLRFDHLTSENGLPQNTIHGIVKDKYGFMWFGTWAGLCKYDGYKFTTYRSDPGDPHSIVNNRIHNLYKDVNQNIWISTFDTATICRYRYETDDFERIPKAKVPKVILESNDRPRHYSRTFFTAGEYKWNMDSWTKSLVQTHIPSGRQHTYKANPSNRWSLNDEYVADIYLDNHRVLWVGTYSYGINKADINAKPFTLFNHDPENDRSILDNNTRAICEDSRGNLWIGTRDKGITVMNRQKNTYTHYTNSLQNANSLVNNQVRKIYEDSYGFVWIGTKKGLDRFDPATGTFHHYGKTLPSTAVYWVMEDRNKELWIGTWRGAAKYDRKNDSFRNYDKYTTLENRNIRVMLEDRNDNLWIGSEGGGILVFRRRPAGDGSEKLQLIAKYQAGSGSAVALSDNRIYVLYQDRQGMVWIGTGNGLNRLDPQTNTIRKFSVDEGLADAMITGILEDDRGFLWISHKRGLTRLNKKTAAIRNFMMQDGLQSNEFAEDTYFKSKRTRELFFGGTNGFNSFYPDSIRDEQHYPQIAFTGLQVLNQPVKINEKVNDAVILSKALNLTKHITLSYKDRSFAIEFAALHYVNPMGNKYAYMLEGFDKNWIYTDASMRMASYSNLPPNQYVFKVKAANSDGVWNPVPATLNITVAPPFWATAWAYAFYILLIACLLYVFYTYSIKIARLKSKLVYESLIREKEHELHQNKLQFFTHISHEIKTPLTLILSPIERLLQLDEGNNRVHNQLMIMRRNGDRLLRLINQLLDFRKFETDHTDLQVTEVELVGFLRELKFSFELAAVQKNMSFTFTCSEDRIHTLLDKDKLEKIIVNLLSNAFKFSPEGANVAMSVEACRDETRRGNLVITITDNGRGIPEDKIKGIFEPFNHYTHDQVEGTGLGLFYSRGLAELLGGTLTVASGTTDAGKEAKHTCFTLILPLAEPLPGKSIAAVSAIDYHDQHGIRYGQDFGAYENVQTPGKDAAIKIDGRTPVILIIEDNEELRSYLADCLAGSYTILQASDGTQGVVTAITMVPDLVISDVMMPGKSGIELCKTLKSDMRTSHIPVILLTALSPAGFKMQGYETGADDYITKPFNLQILETRVRNLLVSRIKLRERFKTEFSLQPSYVAITSPDEKFLNKALQYIEERLSDPELNVEDICKAIGLSRTHLYRKTKALTGLTMADVIRNIRLKRAVQLLEQEKVNINEVAYLVGFLDVDYFRKCFKAHYGFTPSEYQRNMQTNQVK